MRKIVFAISIIAVLVLSLDSCKPKSKSDAQENQATAVDAAHNSRNSLDWNGSYTGTIPCASCPGINVQIILNLDETYRIGYQYIDRGDSVFSASGKFTWDDDGGVITLDTKDYPPYYKVGENRLFQLDMDKNPITGEFADMYVLTKSVE